MSILNMDVIGLWDSSGWLTYEDYPNPIGVKRAITTRKFWSKTELAYFSYFIPIKSRFFQADKETL